MDSTELKPLWRENLTHMLGCGQQIPKRQHGGRKINDDMQVFCATEAGCRVIGMSPAEIEKAMEVL